jgi:signal transduction histidine kinase
MRPPGSLISEILVLARVDADTPCRAGGPQRPARHRAKDAQLAHRSRSAPETQPGLTLQGWPTMIERAVDNLLRNAQRFNPVGSRSK